MPQKISVFRVGSSVPLALAAVMTIFATLSTASAQSTATATSADRARCSQLYSTWSKYRGNGSNYSNEDMRAEVAAQQCKEGRTDQGVAELESQLRAKGVPAPPPQAARAQ